VRPLILCFTSFDELAESEGFEELDAPSFTIIVSFSLAFSFSPLTVNVRLNSPVVFSFSLLEVFLFKVIVTSTLSPFFKLLCLLNEISGFDKKLGISALEFVTSGIFIIFWFFCIYWWNSIVLLF
jgi:hypothetical protein